MAASSVRVETLQLPEEGLSIIDSNSSDSNSTVAPSPSSAATSFELPTKDAQPEQSRASKTLTQAVTPCNASFPQFSSPPPLSFLTLPSDIHHLILTSYLPYDSIVALRSTSTYFQSILPPPTLKRLRQNVIASLLAEENALLQKWLPQPYGRYSGRPATHMTCYSCLQSLPVTEFFTYQVSSSRGLGRKRASQRCCKPCALKYGKIRHGRWMDEVSYSQDDKLRYESVMRVELNVTNPCVTCTPKHRYDGQHVWWGCVDCFEKEEKRLQREDSERRRDVRGHCSRVKRGVKAFVEPENLREMGREVGWWVRSLGWTGIMTRGYSVYWWASDEGLWPKTCRCCRRVGGWLDPRQIKEPGERLGRKAKKAVGNVLGLAKEEKDRTGTSEGVGSGEATVEECFVCNAHEIDRTLKEFDLVCSHVRIPTTHDGHKHVRVPVPRREVRCWRCWRAKRSRRRRRYDDGMAFGLPLPMERWCDGCRIEHDRFVAMKKGRNLRREDGKEGRRLQVQLEQRKKEEQGTERRPRDEEENEEAVDGLVGLFGEVEG